MFSSVTDPETKDQIITEFSKNDGYLRILISTVAFGYGVDINNIRSTFIYGLPTSYLTLVQEIGRTARNLNWGKAILFPFKPAIHRYVAGDVKITTDRCIREQLMSIFYVNKKLEDSNVITQYIEDYCQLCCCCTFHREQCNCGSVPSDIL